jgi:CxxC motif-containing protein (DUF1111 family)
MNVKKTVASIAFGLVTSLAWQAAANSPIFFGDPFSTLTTAQLNQFDAGKDDFSQEENVADGLGPVFNGRSCADCHKSPAVGGDSDITEIRFGTVTNHQFDPLTQFGGSLIQSQGIGGEPGATCDIYGEIVPTEATIDIKRKTTPLFGLGLVDNVPDSVFIAIAQLQKRITPKTAGRPNLVTNLATERLAVGKFGWKSQNPTLFQFSGDAYVNEMGITNPMFPNENCPQGNCALLRTCDPVPADPEDNGSGVQAFTDFMTFLAPPPRGPVNRQTLAGELVFIKIGCANCHLPVLQTGPSSTAALDRVIFQPFSDFLIHDMGNLGDGIEQGQATGREMRTAPLWGLRARTTLLHDGRAATISDAIVAHDGQGSQARERFKALSANDVANLLAFLNSL